MMIDLALSSQSNNALHCTQTLRSRTTNVANMAPQRRNGNSHCCLCPMPCPLPTACGTRSGNEHISRGNSRNKLHFMDTGFSMRQETPTPNNRLHLQTRTCARSLAAVWFTLSMVQTRAAKRCTFRDAEQLARTIRPLMTRMPVLLMNNVQTSEHVSLKLHPVFCRWPRKKGVGSRLAQNANDKQHERAKNGGGRVNRMSGHMSKEQDAQNKSLADNIGQ